MRRAIRIIDKKGPLEQPGRPRPLHPVHGCGAADLRPPDRVGLRRFALGIRASTIARKIVCVEDPQFTKDYHDPEKRSIANALTVEFNDGKKLKKSSVEYPIGHKRRRAGREVPDQSGTALPNQAAEGDSRVSLDQKSARAMPVNEYVDLYVI
jgi:2-methylcitrate dehydratase